MLKRLWALAVVAVASIAPAVHGQAFQLELVNVATNNSSQPTAANITPGQTFTYTPGTAAQFRFDVYLRQTAVNANYTLSPQPTNNISPAPGVNGITIPALGVYTPGVGTAGAASPLNITSAPIGGSTTNGVVTNPTGGGIVFSRNPGPAGTFYLDSNGDPTSTTYGNTSAGIVSGSAIANELVNFGSAVQLPVTKAIFAPAGSTLGAANYRARIGTLTVNIPATATGSQLFAVGRATDGFNLSLGSNQGFNPDDGSVSPLPQTQLVAGAVEDVLRSFTLPTGGTFNAATETVPYFFRVAPVPEPATFLLAGAAGLGLAVLRRRKAAIAAATVA